MNGKVHYSACPVCESAAINPLFTARDYTVSGENFVIWQCAGCSLRFTQDVPDEGSISPYYKSPAYISHTNTNEGMISRLYQKVRTVTLEEKASLVIRKTGKKRGKILDMGCGTGAFLHTMERKGWVLDGVEPDEDARDLGRKLYNLNINDASVLPYLLPDTYDAITLWHVLEHVHRLHESIEQFKSLLTPRGRMFIAVPNYESFDAVVYGPQWAAYDVPRHLYHFSPKAMKELMQRHGLVIRGKKPMWYDSFYVSLLSSKYRMGKTSWFSAGWNGVRSNAKALLNTNRASSIIYIIGKA